jgi:hypothetical protein
MSHGRLNCSGGHGFIVPSDITCTSKAGDDSASCDIYSHLRIPQTMTGEKYHRVSAEYCN